MVNSAEDYPNTIELAAEKYYNYWINEQIKQVKEAEEFVDDPIYTSDYKSRPEYEKETFRAIVAVVLNSVNYFEDKTCKDCGYFDSVNHACFGEDREHPEQADSKLCQNFAPKPLVEVGVFGSEDA